MSQELSGYFETMTINLDDIRSYVISKTLADEYIPRGGLVLRAIACERVAHEWDVIPDHVELQSWDSMHVLQPREGKEPLDAWEVEFSCLVWCDECEHIAVHQTEFKPNLCKHHLDEAHEQHWADLHNDDRAIGLLP